MASSDSAIISAPRAPSAPRRERKKRQTRDALMRAGLELFRTKGYDHTAVHEITDVVDVSERTFFRYFASKEELALAFVQEGAEAFANTLRRRPRSEEPLVALRNALHQSLAEMRADDNTAVDEQAYLSMIELIDATPALLAAHLRYIHEHDDQIIRVLAERENVDPETDLRPRVLSAMFGALLFMANRTWRISGGGGIEPMAAALDQYAEQLVPALAGHWTAPPTDAARSA